MKNIFAKTGFISPILVILFLASLLSYPSLLVADDDDDDDDDDDRRAKVRRVKCDKGKSIQKKLDKAKPGDVIEVSGSCSENVTVVKNRITLRGVGGATLDGPDTTEPTIRVQGLNTTIEDFSSISGSRNVIIVNRGASALIQSNTIENGRRGILVNQGAYARIVGNTIQNNTALPSRDGVTIRQSASADILSNTITGNGRNGILVSGGAAADIDDNTITGNSGDGIRIRFTSHIRLSSESGLGLANRINGNTGRGVQCQTNSSIRSRTAQDFTGGNTGGNTLIDASCVVDGALL